MSEIFTRDALNRIMEDGELTPPQRVEQVYDLYGRALEEGYVGKADALQIRKAAVEAAVRRARTEWEQGQTTPNVVESDEYRALKGEFDAYRAMQEARMSADYAGVKPKFFETVYGMVDRTEGAKGVAEQLASIRRDFEEYFMEKPANPVPGRPSPAVVLPSGGRITPGRRLSLSEAMRRANAGERVDMGMVE